MKSKIIFENWKTVTVDGVEYKNYEVSNLGHVRSWIDTHGNRRSTPIIMCISEHRNGYLQVKLRNGNVIRNLYIHRLVVEAFIGRIPKGYEVNHIDEDKKNNCLSNLEIVTRKQNLNHGTRSLRAALSMSKQLHIMEVEYPHRELTFINACEASKFFDYKLPQQVGTYISIARKSNSNIIKLRGKDYYYSLEKKGKSANV